MARPHLRCRRFEFAMGDAAHAEPHPRSVGLPLRARGATWIACALLWVMYVATMARDLSFYDSPELALVAVGLGLGHPTGQPLHTLLGHALASLPMLPPLFAVNLLSATAGALCLVPAVSIAEQLLGESAAARGPRDILTIALWVALGLHFALWEPSTRVEVYSLAALGTSWAIARVGLSGASGVPPANARDFAAAGFALGLAACANPYMSVIAGLCIAPCACSALVTRRTSWHAVPAAVAGGLLGLLPYAYVPLIAARQDVLVWGAPTHAAALRHYALGLDYGHSRGITAADWIAHGWDWVRWSASRGILPIALLGVFGALITGRRAFALGAVVAWCATIAIVASNPIWAPDLPDYLGYFLTPQWLAAAGITAAFVQVRRRARPLVSSAFAAAVIALCVSVAPPVWARTRHLDRVARMLAEGALGEAPHDALLVVETDHWAAPLLYLQQIEHMRPDVAIIAYGLSSSSWYWEQLFRRHRQLRTIELAGPGGRPARVQRLLARNSERPVQFENVDLANRLARPACVTGWLRTSAPSCDALAPHAQVDTAIERATALLGDGAPSAVDALSQVALERGLDLWRQGDTDAAERALLAAVPRELLPKVARAPEAAVNSPHVAPTIAWQRRAPLGDPARNLFLAAVLRAERRDFAGAAAFAAAAARLGLPEAEQLLARSAR